MKGPAVGCNEFTLKDGEAVLVWVPYARPGKKRFRVTLDFEPMTGQGKNRQRCQAKYNGKTATIRRVKTDDEENLPGARQ